MKALKNCVGNVLRIFGRKPKKKPDSSVYPMF